MNIRKEIPSDIDAITQVTKLAFKDHPYSNQTEHHIINALRAAGALTLSLVALDNEKIVGHIAFSPVTFTDHTENWFGIGPFSVLPELQKKGIGTKLITQGLQMLKELSVKRLHTRRRPQFLQTVCLQKPHRPHPPGRPARKPPLSPLR